jgi:hypothetical protein
MEVVSPPLPMDRLDGLDAHRPAAGCRRPRHPGRLAFAFGVHLNPELPDTDADTVTRYLKAFLCLFDWLRKRSPGRSAAPADVYIDPFPHELCAPGDRAVLPARPRYAHR